MKKIYLVLILSFITTGVWAQKVPFPSDLLASDFPGKLAKSLVEELENSQDYKPVGAQESLEQIADGLYSTGIIKLEAYNKFACKIEELKKIQTILEGISYSGKHECYKNFVNKFVSNTCNKDFTFANYFPNRSPQTSSSFKGKYQCHGKVYSSGGGISIPSMYPYFHNKDKQLYHYLYAKLITRFIAQNKNNTNTYASEYEMATTRQCKPGLARFRFANFKTAPNTCEVSGKECSKHEDCCSKNCLKKTGEPVGACIQEMSCYKLIPKNEECGDMGGERYNPYCSNIYTEYALDPENKTKPQPGKKSYECIETSFNTSGIGECTAEGQTPTASAPCCSDKVGSDGKCVRKFTCDVCYKDGQTPPADEKCCAGFYKSMKGNCVQDFPPLRMNPTTKVKKNSIFKNILSALSLTAHANVQELEQDGSGGGGDGGGSTGSGGGSGNGTAGGGNGNTASSVLTAEERKDFAERRANCLSGSDQEAIKTCLSDTSKIESDLISKRLNDPNFNSSLISREDYIKKFNRAVIIEKRSSNFENCEFHSYNDNWNSGSDTFRNAEIVMRGFEYMYSGKGTKDYWIDKSGQSIFERAQKVALKFRKNRRELIDKYKEIDIEMTEKCHKIFTNKKWGAGAEGNPGDLTTEDKAQQVSDIDDGASGKKQTQLMIEFLDLKRDALMTYFAANSEDDGSEELMEELSEAVANNKWEQSWRRDTKLYDFKLKKLKGFWQFFVDLTKVLTTFLTMAIDMVTMPLQLIFTGSFDPVLTNALWGYGQGSFGQTHTAGTIEKSMYGVLERKIDNRVTRDWYGSGWFHKKKDYDSYYVGPYFHSSKGTSELKDGVANSNGNICEVNASSRLCFKNVHAIAYQAPNDEEAKPRYLLDIKFPEFVSDSKFEVDSKVPSMINRSYGIAINKLRTTDPGTTKPKWMNNDFLGRKEYAKEFLPKASNWVPRIFTAEMIKIFKAGVRKYAKCEELLACGAKNAEEGEYGFGLLISTDEDANAFADYVYQHHYVWPSLSAPTELAYPTIAQSSYFQSVSYYLRVIGSLAATKAGDFGVLADKYREHLTNLDGEYDKGAGASQGRSKNAKYSKEFNQKFALLNFQTGQGVDAYIGDGGKPIIPQGFNSSESTAFRAGINKAIRAKKLHAKAEHYKKTVGNTKRAKIKQQAQSSFMQKFGRPIDNMSKSLRQGLKAAPTIAKDSNKKKETDKSKNMYAAYVPPKVPSYGGQGYGGGYSGRASNSNSNSKPKKVSSDNIAKNMMLLDSAKKMQRDLKRDDGDSLFKIVTKAYFRNLDLILEKINPSKVDSKKVKSLEYQRKKDMISNDKKSELKKLLSQ